MLIPSVRSALTAVGLFIASGLLFGQDTKTLTTIFSFNGSDGEAPFAGVLTGSNGVLYGTTASGKACDGVRDGCGLVFELTPPASGSGQWKQTVLYHFLGTPDGDHPYGSLVMGADGTIYGTTLYGGSGKRACGGVRRGCGTVFALKRSGNVWKETIIHVFQGGSDGTYPQSGLTIDASGNLYGSAGGGASGNGVIYGLTPPATAGGHWMETILYNFSGAEGGSPDGPLVLDGQGFLYGATTYGGSFPNAGGTVFQLVPPAVPGGAWTENILWSFGGPGDGSDPSAGLIFDGSGNLYGTTYRGGTANAGSVFELMAPTSVGAPWTEAVLYSFTGTTDGGYPLTPVAIDTTGTLYGTITGSSGRKGKVFELAPPSSSGGSWTETVLHTFGNYPDGRDPQGGLALGNDGLLYGTTSEGGTSGNGTVFRVTPPAP